jgi:hypothetical protein
MRRFAPWPAAAALVVGAGAVAGCGGGGSAAPTVTVAPARVYQLAGFQPSGPVKPGQPTTVSFTIQQPNGKPLIDYKRGAGPHTGVHLIIVRDDLSSIIHLHPPIASDGRVSEKVVLPKPGPYHVVVDAYPNTTGAFRNFQLTHTITASGRARTLVLPPFQAKQVIDGYTFTMQKPVTLKAIQAAFLNVTVTDPNGKPAEFETWYGALAHAIFFRQSSLDYFHTHVCAPGAAACASLVGSARIAGTSATPGKLHVGVLVPLGGTWRLFLQTMVDGKILTAPYTLVVKPS